MRSVVVMTVMVVMTMFAVLSMFSMFMLVMRVTIEIFRLCSLDDSHIDNVQIGIFTR